MAKRRPAQAPLLGIRKRKAWAPLQEDLKQAQMLLETSESMTTWHSFRKCYVDALVATGADVKTTMALARYSTPSLTMET